MLSSCSCSCPPPLAFHPPRPAGIKPRARDPRPLGSTAGNGTAWRGPSSALRERTAGTVLLAGKIQRSLRGNREFHIAFTCWGSPSRSKPSTNTYTHTHGAPLEMRNFSIRGSPGHVEGGVGKTPSPRLVGEDIPRNMLESDRPGCNAGHVSIPTPSSFPCQIAALCKSFAGTTRGSSRARVHGPCRDGRQLSLAQQARASCWARTYLREKR